MPNKYYYQHREAYFEDRVCMYCGTTDNSVLVLHHVDPETKSMHTSQIFYYKDGEKHKEEIDKCIILCNTCHKKYHRIGWRRKFCYPTIHWHIRNKKWFVRLSINGSRANLGYFKTKPEAIAFANQYALENI